MSTPATPAPPASGLFAALGAYLCWGLFPLYWKHLAAIDAFELIAHRHVWSLATAGVLMVWLPGWRQVVETLQRPPIAGFALLASVLLTGNWLIFVWAVNSGHVIECSLGYFLVPLVNVLVARFVLNEPLSTRQIWAIVLAASGVALLMVRVGRVPWIAFGIIATWAGYSLLKKRTPLQALPGFALETLLLAPFAAAFLIWLALTGRGVLGHVDMPTAALVVSSGVVTALPLLLFAAAARRLPLATLGLLQYVVPTCQFLIGWLLYDEVFTANHALAFALIWLGLAFYGVDLLRLRRIAASA